MRDLQRNLVFIAFVLISFKIWQIWHVEYAPTQLQWKNNQNLQITHHIDPPEKIITVKTDVLELSISPKGGNVIQAKLLGFPESSVIKNPLKLLDTTSTFLYQAHSKLLVAVKQRNSFSKNLFIDKNNALYKTTSNHFCLKPGQQTIQIPLSWENKGIIYKKIFVLHRNQYSIDINYLVNNQSNDSIEVSLIGKLKQSLQLPSSLKNHGHLNIQTYRGVAYSTDKEKYVKYKFKKISNNTNLDIKTSKGWIAMLQQYFITAWIPHTKGVNKFFTEQEKGNIVSVGYQATPITIYPHQKELLSATLWVGPGLQDQMSLVAPYLDLTVDYGLLWFISQPLFKLLKFIHKIIGNWGFSIILITFIVRVIMYPVTKAQYTSMVKMRLLQPKIQEIRDRIGDDNKYRLSQEIMALYQSEKVNPLGGCLPLMIQMPIFLALYYMLVNSVELRQAPFILWIHDLSAHDPYYILPLGMGITLYFLQTMSPNTMTDPSQQKILTYMPIICSIFFFWFPSGLVLYYIVSNLLTILQQILISYSINQKQDRRPNNKENA
ncbi:MAG: membrane protein insertase YidC [Candidatus Dasytiphilus stammeri]